MLICAQRIKPKSAHPWKTRDIVRLLTDAFEWDEVEVGADQRWTDAGYARQESGRTHLRGHHGVVTVWRNYCLEEYWDSKQPEESGHRFDWQLEVPVGVEQDVPRNATLISVENAEVAAFLLALPQCFALTTRADA